MSNVFTRNWMMLDPTLFKELWSKEIAKGRIVFGSLESAVRMRMRGKRQIAKRLIPIWKKNRGRFSGEVVLYNAVDRKSFLEELAIACIGDLWFKDPEEGMVIADIDADVWDYDPIKLMIQLTCLIPSGGFVEGNPTYDALADAFGYVRTQYIIEKRHKRFNVDESYELPAMFRDKDGLDIGESFHPDTPLHTSVNVNARVYEDDFVPIATELMKYLAAEASTLATAEAG